MQIQEVQQQIAGLQLAIREERYGDAETLMRSFMTDFPSYHTPLILYVDLHPYIDVNNPLYNQILELTRQYQQFQEFPAELVPSWYRKIMTRNLKLVSEEQQEPNPAEPASLPGALPDLEDNSDVLDQLQSVNGPIEEEAEPEIHLVDPHSLVEDMESDQSQSFTEAENHPDDEIMIASETMAEIFAQQQKFGKAIRVYEMLIKEEPELASEYQDRINSLKSMMKS